MTKYHPGHGPILRSISPFRGVFLAGCCLLALSSVVFEARASGGTGEYDLDWSRRGERLAYHSCGCADACWVAEVRNRQSRAVRGRLRCDCEKLYFWQPGHGGERVVAESCDETNNPDKPNAIRKHLEHLLRNSSKAR